MRLLPVVLLALFAAGSAFAQTEFGPDDAYIRALRDKNPEVRKSAARILGAHEEKDALETIILVLHDEQDESVKKEFFAALRQINQAHPEELPKEDDVAKWMEWFEKHKPSGIPEGAKRQLNTYQTIAIVCIGAGVLVLIAVVGVLVAFGAMASNRMKAMKELSLKVEALLKDGAEVKARSGSVMEAIDAKKAEIITFFTKLKDENESEIERYGDMIEQNIEHRMREITMTLREKAEKELEQTFNEMKDEIDRRIRTVTEGQKDAMMKELTLRQQGFLADVEAHTMFLEASFFFISGKLPDALRVYKKLLQLKPTHYIAWNNYGTILRDLMRYDEALEAYGRALDHSPDNPGVLYLFATVHALTKKKDKMLEFLKRAIVFDPEFQDEALNDKAFKDYWEDPEFKDVAEG